MTATAPTFCRFCGASIPKRTGEGTCRFCDPQGVIDHLQALCADVMPPAADDLTTSRATCARLHEEIAEAREACPIVRRQDYFDAPLLTLINHEIVRSLQMQSRAETAEAQVATLTAALRRYGKHDNHCKVMAAAAYFSEGAGRLQYVEPKPCTCGLDAVLRAASEGAP